MAGHSKWNNIKRKKEKTDAQKAKIFTKIGREISVAVRENGPDPASNGKLRDLIQKAKSLNVPNDNIYRVIKKAEGGERDDYENITYEGYGPAGIAVMVETLTDNRNRTASNMRHYFDKYGGNLGQAGSVSFQFSDKGIIVIEVNNGLDEEKLMEDVFEAGADDFEIEDGICEIITAANDVFAVSEALTAAGYEVASAERAFIADNASVLEGEDNLKKMNLLIEHLEDDDDVQNIWHNMENIEDLEQ